jgi:NTE family protein
VTAAESDTDYFFFEDREALVLAGGGARAAYQVGVLRAIADWLPEDTPCPFEVLVGTSAGAINAASLAARSPSLREAVATLERVWSGFSVDQVFDVDNLSMVRAGLHWLLAMASGGWLLPAPRSLFDTEPLRELLAREIPFERIPENVQKGPLRALAVATTSYSSGRAVAFFDAPAELAEWRRVRRAGVRRAVDIDVLMATAAIPFMFPAAQIDGEYFGDGAMRQLAPLSPAVHLGANRMLVVGTRAEAPASPADGAVGTAPSPGHLLGFVLDSLFTDGLSIDLERLHQINSLLELHPEASAPGRRPIDTLVIQPSEDPTRIARRHVSAMPRSVRRLLRTMGALEARGGLLVSYLLFESVYTKKLMQLGRADAEARREEIVAFLRSTFRAKRSSPDREAMRSQRRP